MTGEEFHPNRYRLYVATQTKDGVIALAEADKHIYIKPYPKKVILHGSGEKIEDYSVEFESFNHSDIEYNVVFYSTETIYEPTLISFLDKSMEDIEGLIDEKRLKKADKLNSIEFFEDNQISLEGNAFGENIYYGYVAAIGSSGVLGVTYSKSMIITKNTPNPETELINDGKGTVFAVGGSTDSSNYEYMLQILDEIGRKPRIAIFSSSRDDLSTVINHYYYDDPQFGSLKDDWVSRGFEPVFIPLAIDSRDFVANNDYYSALVKTCDAVWLQGGDQNKHGKSLLNDDGSDTSIMEAIRYVYSRGGVIAGTSAGMHIMSNNAFGYGNSDIALQVNNTEFYSISDIPTSGDLFPNIPNNNLSIPGINIMPSGVLNDTHFDARGRLGRLIVAMRDTEKTIGIGSDEGTGIAVRENIGTVIGVHGVFIVDGANEKYSQNGDASIFNASDIKVHYLTHGDSYNFETGEIVIAKDKEEIESEFNKAMYETDNIFGKYETTKAMISFVNSGENKVSYRVKSNSNPQFEVVFEKTENTSSYQSSDPYKDSALAGFKRTSILNLSLKIQEYKEIDEFVLSSVEVGRYGNDTEFAVTFIFNQPIKVGYKGSSGDYLNDLEDPEYFVEILRGEEILEQGKSSLKIVDGNKLEVVAGKEDFKNGDSIVLKTTIESVFGGTLTEEIRYSYMDGNWILSSDYQDIQEEILEEVEEEILEEAQEEILEEVKEEVEKEILEDIQEETVEEVEEETLEEIQKEVEKGNE